MTARLIVSASLAVALFGGCSSSDDPDPVAGSGGGPGPGSPPEGVPGTLIEGIWESPCLMTGNVSESRAFVLTITERVFQLNEMLYADGSCEDALWALTTRGSFEERPIEDGREPADGIPIDLSINQFTLVPLLQQTADRFNQEATCGITGWTPAVDQDVSGCTEFVGVAAPRTDYNRYFVDDRGTIDVRADDTLALGTLGPQTDEAMRPAGVDAEIVFTRRPGSV